MYIFKIQPLHEMNLERGFAPLSGLGFLLKNSMFPVGKPRQVASSALCEGSTMAMTFNREPSKVVGGHGSVYPNGVHRRVPS